MNQKFSIRRIGRRGLVAVTAFGIIASGAAVAVAEVTEPNTTSLKVVGPISGEHGFPVWYEDEKADGSKLRLEQCLDVNDPYCDPAFLVEEGLTPGEPLRIADVAAESNFPGESFYYQGLNVFDLPNGGSVDFTSALEATFANEEPVDGDQVVFGRIRIRIDGLQPNAEYKVTHPYGVDTFTADGEGEINFTEDKTPAPGNFGLALGSRVAPFLVDADGLHTNDMGTYVGDPAEETRVTGSVFDTNFVQVAGPGLPDGGARNDLFTLLGKVSTNDGINPLGAHIVDNATGQDFVDVWATAGANDAVQVSGDGIPLTTMAANGATYFARIPVTENTFPKTVKVTNASDKPVASKDVPLTDNVQVTAVYDNGVMTVGATSSDADAELKVSGYTNAEGAPYVIGADPVQVTGLALPPYEVTVESSSGGKATVEVLVNGAAPAEVVPQTAIFSGPETVAMGQSVELDASSSTNVTSYDWKASAGEVSPNGSGQTATFTAPSEVGPVDVTLTTTGPQGQVSSVKTIEVLGTDVATTLEVTANDDTPEVGSQVVLTASATNATSIEWAQTAGPEVIPPGTTGSRVTFTAPSQQVTFTVTANGPGGPVSKDIAVTPNADVLEVTSAELRTSKTEWRITGTATVTALNNVTVYLQNADGTKGTAVGTATVDTLGDWTVRTRNGVNPAGATRLIVESTKGGSLKDVTFTTRR